MRTAVLTLSNDGVRLWINEVQLVNDWADHATKVTNITVPVPLVAGEPVAVRLEFYENTGAAEIRLQAQVPGSASYVAIPLEQFSPP